MSSVVPTSEESVTEVRTERTAAGASAAVTDCPVDVASIILSKLVVETSAGGSLDSSADGNSEAGDSFTGSCSTICSCIRLGSGGDFKEGDFTEGADCSASPATCDCASCWLLSGSDLGGNEGSSGRLLLGRSASYPGIDSRVDSCEDTCVSAVLLKLPSLLTLLLFLRLLPAVATPKSAAEGGLFSQCLESEYSCLI